MIGLVIWSDNAANKAVFWCEDHGDLAYFTAGSDGSGVIHSLEPGDMVEFDVRCSDNVRLAHNPQLVSRKTCHGIQDELRRNAAPRKDSAAPVQGGSGNVVAFPGEQVKQGIPLVS